MRIFIKLSPILTLLFVISCTFHRSSKNSSLGELSLSIFRQVFDSGDTIGDAAAANFRGQRNRPDTGQNAPGLIRQISSSRWAAQEIERSGPQIGRGG